MSEPTAVTARINLQRLGPRLKLTLGNLFSLRNALDINSPNHLEAKLARHINLLYEKIDYNAGLGHEDINWQDPAILLADHIKIDLIHKYLSANPTGRTAEILESTLMDLGLKVVADLPGAAEEGKVDLPVPENDSSVAFAAQGALVRGQVFNTHDLNISCKIPMGSLIAVAETQNIPVGDLIGNLVVETKSKASSPVVTLAGHFILTLTIDRMLHDIAHEVDFNTEISPEVVEEIVNNQSHEMVKIAVKTTPIIGNQSVANSVEFEPVKIFAETASLRPNQPAAYNASPKPVQIAAQPSPVAKDQITKNSDSTVIIKVAGRSRKGELIKTAAELINSQPSQAIPLMAEMAAEAIAQKPEDKQEVIQFLSAVICETQPLAAESAAAVLPALLSELKVAQANNKPAEEAIEMILTYFAKNEAGQAQVIQKFSEGKQEISNSSQVNAQIALQTVQSMLDNARDNPDSVKLNFSAQSRTEQLFNIGQLFVEANQVRLSTENLTADTAKEFIKFIAQVQRAVESIIPKEAEKHLSPEKLTSIPASKEAVVLNREVLSNLITTARDLELTIPTAVLTVIGSHLAAIAGITGVKESANKARILPTPQDFQVPQDSARASSLQAVANALETQVGQALPEVTKGQMSSTTGLSIAAELLVYGLILKRVKGDLEKTMEIIQALKEKELLKHLISAIEAIDKDKEDTEQNFIDIENEYEVEDVDDFINDIALMVRLYGSGKLSVLALINRLIKPNARSLIQDRMQVLGKLFR